MMTMPILNTQREIEYESPKYLGTTVLELSKLHMNQLN